MQNLDAVKLAPLNNDLFVANSATTLKVINERDLFNDAIRRPNSCNRNDGFFDSWSISILFFDTKSYDKACKTIRYEN